MPEPIIICIGCPSIPYIRIDGRWWWMMLSHVAAAVAKFWAMGLATGVGYSPVL
jgi:hypothetical protein